MIESQARRKSQCHRHEWNEPLSYKQCPKARAQDKSQAKIALEFLNVPFEQFIHFLLPFIVHDEKINILKSYWSRYFCTPP